VREKERDRRKEREGEGEREREGDGECNRCGERKLKNMEQSRKRQR